jgi:hypothetical protein
MQECAELMAHSAESDAKIVTVVLERGYLGYHFEF